MSSGPFQVLRRDVDDWFNQEKVCNIIVLDNL
jgi:hypothetical protein